MTIRINFTATFITNIWTYWNDRKLVMKTFKYFKFLLKTVDLEVRMANWKVEWGLIRCLVKSNVTDYLLDVSQGITILLEIINLNVPISFKFTSLFKYKNLIMSLSHTMTWIRNNTIYLQLDKRFEVFVGHY